MSNQDQNWNNLFGDHTTDATAWYGCWTVYSPNQEVIKRQQAIRSFQSNSDNTVITHTNRYLDTDGTVVDEKTWHIDRKACNQLDGVVHPGMPSQRTLSFGAGATAWISPQLIPGQVFGVELFFRDGNWRSSAVIVYRANGQLDKIVHIREHLGHFSSESPNLESIELTVAWIGEKCSMTPDLSISPIEKTQLSAHLSEHYKLITLPEGMLLMLPDTAMVGQPIQIAAGQQTANHQLKYLTVHYATDGAFTLLVSAALQQQEK